MFVMKKTCADPFDKAKGLVQLFIYSEAAGSLYYCYAEPKINCKTQGQ